MILASISAPTQFHINAMRSPPRSADPTKWAGDHGSRLAIPWPLLAPVMTTLPRPWMFDTKFLRKLQSSVRKRGILGHDSKLNRSVLRAGASVLKELRDFPD
jgi:hypothetical protein